MKEKCHCRVIVCGPAIGKTYLAEHDDRFIDLDEIKSDYKYGLENATREEKERGKLNRGEIVRKDSTEYAIKILQKELKGNHFILISDGNERLFKYIKENNIEYCLVYAGIELVDEYIERMKRRGNSSSFIEKITNEEKWKQTYLNYRNDEKAKCKIELKKGQYLEDIKDKLILGQE